MLRRALWCAVRRWERDGDLTPGTARRLKGAVLSNPTRRDGNVEVSFIDDFQSALLSLEAADGGLVGRDGRILQALRELLGFLIEHRKEIMEIITFLLPLFGL